MFKQAAVQGIPVIAASGDSGAYDINRNVPYPDCSTLLTVDYPAADPYVLAAGGTSLPNASLHKHGTVSQPYERPWGGDYLKDYITKYYGLGLYYSTYLPEGGGGGVSVRFGPSELPERPDGRADVRHRAVAAVRPGHHRRRLCGLLGPGAERGRPQPARRRAQCRPGQRLRAAVRRRLPKAAGAAPASWRRSSTAS